MAVVTHQGVLPDSSQKSDFYSIIDNATVTGIVNADCSNSMALADSKLAQITTASKVSVSAITGTLPAANGGTGSANAINTAGGVLVPVGAPNAANGAVVPTGATNAANGAVILNGSTQLPALDGSLLTAIIASISDYGTSSTTGSAVLLKNLRIVYGTVAVGSASTQTVTNLPFASNTSYTVVFSWATTSWNATTSNSPNIVKNSGSQFTVDNSATSVASSIGWIAIGT